MGSRPGELSNSPGRVFFVRRPGGADFERETHPSYNDSPSTPLFPPFIAQSPRGRASSFCIPSLFFPPPPRKHLTVLDPSQRSRPSAVLASSEPGPLAFLGRVPSAFVRGGRKKNAPRAIGRSGQSRKRTPIFDNGIFYPARRGVEAMQNRRRDANTLLENVSSV